MVKSTSIAAFGLWAVACCLLLPPPALAEDPPAAPEATGEQAPEAAVEPAPDSAVAAQADEAQGEGPDRFSVTFGIRTGVTYHKIIDQFSATSPNLSPMLDVAYGDWSLGFSFHVARFSTDQTVGIAVLDPQVAQVTGNEIAVGTHGEDTRMDFDVSVKYSLNRYVTPFVGYRHELFRDTKITIESLPEFPEELPPGTPQDLQLKLLLLSQNPPTDFSESIDIDLAAFGMAFQYPVPDANFIPYFVGTGFPYGSVEGVDSPWVGYALEAGVAYLLGVHFDLPLYVIASGKYQVIDVDGKLKLFNEMLNDGNTVTLPGGQTIPLSTSVYDILEQPADAFPIEETIWNGFLGVFYRFTL